MLFGPGILGFRVSKALFNGVEKCVSFQGGISPWPLGRDPGGDKEERGAPKLKASVGALVSH